LTCLESELMRACGTKLTNVGRHLRAPCAIYFVSSLDIHFSSFAVATVSSTS